MEFVAQSKNVRITPRKVRMVADFVRGMTVPAALQKLAFLTKSAAQPTLKTLESAIANAVNNAKADANSLVLKNVIVDEGRVIMRKMDNAHGARFGRGLITKKTSHIRVILESKEKKVTN
jgi:large subunit ribosomal protein L22